MRTRTLALAGSLAALAAPLAAQEITQGSCAANERVAWIGISGMLCNCTLGDSWVFRAEPRISSIEPGSPAAGALREGDVIVAVDGHLITTTEGGRRLAAPAPGERLEIAVRRDGRMVVVHVVPTQLCRTDPRLAVTPRAGRVARMVPSQRAPTLVIGGRADTTVTAGRGGFVAGRAPTPRPSGRVSLAQAAPSLGVALPSAWFGFAISCNQCGWQAEVGQTARWSFREPPRITSVEPGSPAERAGLRAGDLLVRVDGREISSVEGGRRFGAITPGEVVLFTYTRGNEAPRTVSMTADRRASVQSALRALVAKTDTLSRATTRLRETPSPAAEDYRNLVERVRAQAQTAATPAPDAHNRTLRYSGEVGNTQVEVRGGSEVITTILEQGRDIVIITGGTQIRIRVPDHVRRR